MDKDKVQIIDAQTGGKEMTIQLVPDEIIKQPEYQLLMEVANNDKLGDVFKVMLGHHYIAHGDYENCPFCQLLVNW